MAAKGRNVVGWRVFHTKHANTASVVCLYKEHEITVFVSFGRRRKTYSVSQEPVIREMVLKSASLSTSYRRQILARDRENRRASDSTLKVSDQRRNLAKEQWKRKSKRRSWRRSETKAWRLLLLPFLGVTFPGSCEGMSQSIIIATIHPSPLTLSKSFPLASQRKLVPNIATLLQSGRGALLQIWKKIPARALGTSVSGITSCYKYRKEQEEDR